MKRMMVIVSLVLVAALVLPITAAAAGAGEVLLDGRIVFGSSTRWPAARRWTATCWPSAGM
jgi:hypothetical protein